MSFVAVTNAEIDADSPITQALLRKLRDNVEGHNHSAGQGAALSSGSFRDSAFTEAKIADRTLTGQRVAPTFSFAFSPGAIAFDANGENGEADLTTLEQTIVVTRPSRLFVQYRLQLDGATIGTPFWAVKLDGTLRAERSFAPATVRGQSPFFFAADIGEGTHTVTPVAVVFTGVVTVSRFFMMMFATGRST